MRNIGPLKLSIRSARHGARPPERKEGSGGPLEWAGRAARWEAKVDATRRSPQAVAADLPGSTQAAELSPRPLRSAGRRGRARPSAGSCM